MLACSCGTCYHNGGAARPEIGRWDLLTCPFLMSLAQSCSPMETPPDEEKILHITQLWRNKTDFIIYPCIHFPVVYITVDLAKLRS